MSLSNLRVNITEGMNLNLIKTDKLKSNLISFYIIMPLNRKDATKNALIPLVLKRGTKNYSTNLELERKLEEMYGSSMSININKKGERHVLRFTIEFPKGMYVNDEEYFTDVIKMLREIVYEPYLENNFFSHKYVEQEKENLKRIIEGKINNKRDYAINRCIEEMCRNEKYSVYEYGYTEDLDKINEENLYEHYRYILEKFPIEIFYVGEFDEKLIVNIANIFRIDRRNIVEVPREKIASVIQTKNMVYEDMDVNQGKLVIGYRTSLTYEEQLYSSAILANYIFGGGPNSKLFRMVREKESLAYYIGSSMYKYKSLILIDAGIDVDNLEKTIEIIRKQLDEMRNGLFTEEEIKIAKKSVSSQMKSIVDSNYLISEYFLSRVISNDSRTIEEIVEDIYKINKEDIKKASNTFYLDTIYFLGKKN